MSHQGRVHRISGEAEEMSSRILADLPRDGLVRGRLQRPLWSKVEYYDTKEERDYLASVAARYNTTHEENQLLAHGTQDASHLCQILLDGELHHNVGIENYGNLAARGESVQMGGYWDRGWGLFVADSETILDAETNPDNYLVVPLHILEGIALPRQVAETVITHSPEHEHLIKSYRKLAAEIEARM